MRWMSIGFLRFYVVCVEKEEGGGGKTLLYEAAGMSGNIETGVDAYTCGRI